MKNRLLHFVCFFFPFAISQVIYHKQGSVFVSPMIDVVTMAVVISLLAGFVSNRLFPRNTNEE